MILMSASLLVGLVFLTMGPWGSNIFNILGILGVSSLISPMQTVANQGKKLH